MTRKPEVAQALEGAWASAMPGCPFPHSRLQIGPPLANVVLALDPMLDEARRATVISEFRSRYDASDFAATVPYPGVTEALGALRARGATLGIATNKRSAPTGKIVARWFPGSSPMSSAVTGAGPPKATPRAPGPSERCSRGCCARAVRALRRS